MKTPLYKCRRLEGINQGELAKVCGTSAPTISRLETGKSVGVAGDTCLRLVERYESRGLTLKSLINPHNYTDFSPIVDGE